MRPLVSFKKGAKLKSRLVPIPISRQDFIISYCHVYIKGGASIPKEEKSCHQRPLQLAAV